MIGKKAKDPIVQMGAPVLRERTLPVPKKDFGSAKLATVIKKMRTALKPEKYGVAIAAPQIDVSLRLFVVAGRVFAELEAEEGEAKKLLDKVFINPEIIRMSRQKRDESEGCLSVRNIYGTVPRHIKVTLKAQDETGKTVT